jgi:hypothetical protein
MTLTSGFGKNPTCARWRPARTWRLHKRVTLIQPNKFDIYVCNVDGTHLIRLTNDPGDHLAPVWRPVIRSTP